MRRFWAGLVLAAALAGVAARVVAAVTGVSRDDVYARALALKR